VFITVPAVAFATRAARRAALLLVLARSLSAQSATALPEERSVEGRVVRPGATGPLAVPDEWVTLHRVGRDRAGPLDSMRTSREGRYRFRYQTSGSSEAVYFVSAMYGGIAYFSQPLLQARVAGDAAELTVFDTTSGPLPLHIRGRHLVVSASGAEQRRTILEVFEISNDSSMTLVGGEGAGQRPTFSALVPPQARDFKVTQGDVPAEAVTVASGRANVYAPIAPGLKQLAFSYALPRDAFPLSVPLEQAVSVMEVLIEDSAGTVTGPRLAAMSPVSVDGRTFRRYLAQDAPANGVIRVSVPSAPSPPRRLWLEAVIAIAGGAMVLALARALGGRAARSKPDVAPALAPPSSEAPVSPEDADDAELLAREIADLDAGFEARTVQSEGERAEYARTRAALKARLSAALARGAATG
jgi:hypothetical protein